MSVALTTPQVIAREKTVTRRNGWLFAKPGDLLVLCRKVQGRKLGEPLDRLVVVEVVDVRRERLDAISPDECAREGLPDMAPDEFVDFFCASHKGVEPDSIVSRIEWRYREDVPVGGVR